MNSFKSLLLVSISGCTLLSSLAINQTTVSAQSLFPSQTQYTAQQTKLSSVIMVQLPQLEVNLDSGKSSEIMGQLAVPLQLSGLTVPTGAIVRLNLVPTDDGDISLVADKIIIPSNGMTIDISAQGSAIPGETVTDRRGVEVGKEATAVGSFLGERVGLALGGDAEDAIQAGSAGGLGGAIGGLLSPSKRQVVQLVQGVYFLDLN